MIQQQIEKELIYELTYNQRHIDYPGLLISKYSDKIFKEWYPAYTVEEIAQKIIDEETK